LRARWARRGQQVAAAAEALVQAERAGAPAAKRRTLEQQLAEARSAAEKPWPERIEGARRTVRDLDDERQAYVGQHLAELVAVLEEEGRAAADDLDAAAKAVVAAFGERQRVDQAISQLAAMVGRPRPGDVARSHGDAVVREANALLDAGGEVPPRLLHDPREPRHAGSLAESMA
jgi:hypothetical protein